MDEKTQPVNEMSDRELLEELVTGLREIRAQVASVSAGLGQAASHPILGKLLGNISF